MTMTDQTPATPAQTPPAAPSHTLRTVLLVVGSIVLAIVLLATVLRVVGSLNREDTSGTYTVASSFDSIELRATAADVEIQFGSVSRAELRFDQGDTNLRLDKDVSGDELRITVKRPGWGWWGWDFGGPFGDWGVRDGARLIVVLPQSMERDDLDLDLESTAGNLTVSGEFGDVQLESTAGDVRLAGAADDLEVNTTAGNIRLSDFDVRGVFRSDSTAGDSRFEFRTLPRSIDVETTAGDVRVSLPSGSYRIETETTAGQVQQNVSSDAGSDRVYRFTTTAGNIELNDR
jgi:hypothetical protein